MSDSDNTLFFGRRWDAPIVDHALQIDTPIGASCVVCDEPIVDGDCGLIRATVTLDDQQQWTATGAPVHAECEMRGYLGHLVGVCSCTGYPADRATAKLVWQRVGDRRGRDLAIRDDDERPFRRITHRQEDLS